MPPGVNVEYRSAVDPERGSLASDYRFHFGAWERLDGEREMGPIVGGFEYPVSDDRLLREVVISVENATLISDGSVLSQDGTILHGSGFGSRAARRNIAAMTKVDHLAGEHGNVIFRTGNYGHWLLQRLPRLHTLEAQIGQMGYVNLVWHDAGLFARAGVDPARVKNIGRSRETTRFLTVEKLYLASHLATPGHARLIDKHRLERLATRFVNGIGFRGLPRLLHAARNDFRTARPGTVDAPRLARSLEDRGFTTIFPATMTIEDQLAHFLAADVIVSEIGSGALNSMFVQPQTTVIFVTPNTGGQDKRLTTYDPTWRTWQRVVCEARGQHYAQLVATDVQDKMRWPIDLKRLNHALDTYPLRTW